MANDSLEFFFFDVQHGNATYIRTPNNKHIMVDLGTGSLKRNSEVFSPLSYIKTKWGVERLDLVIITHPHADHIADIFKFDSFRPRALFRPNHLTLDEIFASNQSKDMIYLNKYLEISNRYVHPMSDETSLDKPSNYGGVEISTFMSQYISRSNLNNHSIITIFEYKGNKIIIPGDNEAISWRELLKDSSFVRAISNADILLAPHHGREAGFCNEIFEHFSPLLTIISDGPAGDTSVTQKYVAKSNGWQVVSRSNGTTETRKCLTTRADKGINVSFSHNGTNRTIAVSVV